MIKAIQGLASQTDRALAAYNERLALSATDENVRMDHERNKLSASINRVRQVRCSHTLSLAPHPRSPVHPAAVHSRPTNPHAQDNAAVKDQIASTEMQCAELSAKEQQAKQAEATEVPRARHTISLYANISSIRWDYNSALVKGFITSANGSNISSFELGPSQHTNFFTVNMLWGLRDA